MEATADIVVPDVVGEVIGYRAWRVGGLPRFPMLYSASHAGTYWATNRWTHAECAGQPVCKATGGRIPEEACTCGMYAAASLEQLIQLGYGNYGDSGNVHVLGQVGFAGKVVPGSQGWRAEKGRIVRLYVPYCEPHVVGPLASIYRVPVELANTFTGRS